VKGDLLQEEILLKKRISFDDYISDSDLTLSRRNLKVVQVNVGKLCNQACLHCHVEAGPKRTEQMSLEGGERIIQLLKNSPGIETVDITGGAPEMNENFRTIALAARELNLEVIDRCNLTVFFEDGYEDLPQFLRDNEIHVVASLPCYQKENVEKQRGKGVFQPSIDALTLLNSLGYGRDDERLRLDLVYNPIGASLPPEQNALEKKYKEELFELFGISFNSLYTITNVPISRFLHQLEREGRYEEYLELLVSNFNPHAASEVMCRDLVSVSWTGELYDCDFNQMLEIPLGGRKRTIWDIESFSEVAAGEEIAFGEHCFACTAGCGSSCSGSLTRDAAESGSQPETLYQIQGA